MMLFYEGDLDENLVFEFEDLNIFLLSMSFLNLMLVMQHGDAGHMGPEAVFFVTKKSKETAPGNLS